MSTWKRVTLIFRSKANKALDKYEDPNATLDYAYTRQLELLRKVRTGLAEVATSRKRIELQMADVTKKADALTGQAERAIQMGRDDLAREALTRKTFLTSQMSDLTAQRDSLLSEEQKLSEAVRKLQAKVEAFRTRKETLKAQYSAAEAQSRIGEALAGVGGEFDDIGSSMQRAEDKTAQMQARAGALDELLASGALDSPLSAGHGTDALSRELDAISATSDIEAELARLRALPHPSTQPRELG